VESQQRNNSAPRVLFALIFETTLFSGFRANCPGVSLPTGQENSIEAVTASTSHTRRNHAFSLVAILVANCAVYTGFSGSSGH
jgi:hypothetical protein